MTTNVSVEERVSGFVSDLVKIEGVEEAFNLFLVHRSDLDEANTETSIREWLAILQEISELSTESATISSQQEVALRLFVQVMSVQKKSGLIEKMMKHLERAVAERVIQARQVCDVVLSQEFLKYENELYWTTSFQLVQRVIGGVDYKGVREIMKICIDKVVSMPNSESDVSTSKQLDSIKSLLRYIFDRNAALLPGYFIVNEILKSYPENKSWPHWTLVPLVSSFLNSFRPTAQMVTSMNKHCMRPVVESSGRAHSVSTWKLDPNSLKFLLKSTNTYERILPYSKEIIEPQKELFLFVLRQPNCKDMVSSMLGLQKPRKDSNSAPIRYPVLEEQLANLLVRTMKESHKLTEGQRHMIWSGLASELIFFILFQYITFAAFIERLYATLNLDMADEVVPTFRFARDELMWALLQYISGSISKNPLSDFFPVMKLFAIYNEKTPLPLPDTKQKSCVKRMAAAAIFFILRQKADADNVPLPFKIPLALQFHYSHLQNLSANFLSDVGGSLRNGFSLPLFCNTYSTTQEVFQKFMIALCKHIGASSDLPNNVAMPGGHIQAQAPIEPLTVDVLDSLSVHSKMTFIHHIVQYINKHVISKSSITLSPALVETFCRLIVYPEIESLGVKGFLNNLMPLIFKNGAWGILHMLMEIFSFRLHQVQTHYRLSLLNTLQVNLVGGTVPAVTKNNQLHLCLESTTLRLITGLGNSEINPSKSFGGGQQKHILYGDSEELNRVVILTLARSIQINGLEQQSAPWVKEILTNIMQKTPHSWPSHTLQNFPPILQEFFKENPGPKESKSHLRQKLEEEYKTWTSMSSDMERIQHFSLNNNSLFLCVMWKMLLETEHIAPVAYKVLERIGPKQMMNHLRAFCDVLVVEFSKSGGSGHVNKCIEAMNNLIWKYNVVTIDRLILCMALRTNEGNEAQVCFFIIQLLLLKPPEFRTGVNELVKTMSPEHHLLTDFHSTHLKFHQAFPEKFLNSSDPNSDPQGTAATNIPIYFGNVCLRFIPVFDIVVHRFLELPPVAKSLETLIDHVGHLYKFHDKPITYLYNTLHYYEKRVREKPSLKKKLIASITGALRDVRPTDWCLTNDYNVYLNREDSTWAPPNDYYLRLVSRFAEVMKGNSSFPSLDWRFTEFPNEAAHALYVTCVEIMGLPVDPSEATAKILDLVLDFNYLIPDEDLTTWINCIGLIISNMPEAYWDGLYQKLANALKSQPLSQWTLSQSPFQILNFDMVKEKNEPKYLCLLLALTHSVLHHSGFSQIQTLPDLVRERFLPVVKTEEQLLFVFHVTGPYLQRLHSERYMRPLFDLTVQFYRMLQKVDKECSQLRYMDSICDILYHVKYQFTGDSVRQEAEKIVRELSSPLQLRLRFIKGQDPTNSK